MEPSLKMGKELDGNKQEERPFRGKAHEQRAIMSKVCSMGTRRQTCLKEKEGEVGTKPLVTEKERPVPFI